MRHRQGGCHSTSTSLALKVIRIVYNPPFEKFLDPPLDFYRNILFVFPKEKCLPATFVDLQKKSNSSRDSNSVLQILHQGESMLLRYVKFILKFPKFCFYCDNKRQGGDPFPFPCLVGFAFSTCLFNLEICHCPFQANFDQR